MLRCVDAQSKLRGVFVVVHHHLVPANSKLAGQPPDIPSDELLNDDELYDDSNHSVDLIAIFVAFFILI